MRLGQNPAKSIEQVPQPAPVTIAVVNYIPFLSGYYAQSLDVLKACLNSLWQNTPKPYDLLVFDNASCAEVRSFLMEAHQGGQIQYLVLSERNVGKGGAWNFIFQAAPGEVLAYSDSDVFFHPGWLGQSLQILETFPRVGMVSGRPLRTPEAYYSATLDWARQAQGASLEKGQFMPWQVFKEHNDSLGVSEAQAREWFAESHDWRVNFQGMSAYIGAAHFQFVAPKSVLQAMTPFQMDRPMGQVRMLDERLNSAGYLRLAICEPLVRHLGNRLEATAIPDWMPTSARKTSASFSKRLAQVRPVRRGLLWLYDRIFHLYYSNSE